MTTAPKLPEGLVPVAWQYVSEDPLDGGQLMLSEEKPNRRALWPLVRLSDAQAALQALAAEIERLKEDADRWRYVRHHWSNAQMHWNKDATNSLKSIVLTIKTAHWTSGADNLDAAIDSALLAAKEAKQ